MPLAMGVSTVAAGVAELPRAYAEALSALECIVGDGGGVVALPHLSPFGYLALQRGRHGAPARRPAACASSSTRTARAAAC